MVNRLLLSFVFVFSLIYTYAFDLDYRFHHLDLENGLPQSSVLSVFEDSRGFIWLGTYDGLCRFDGKQLKVFLPKENDNYTIDAGSIYKIQEGFDHKIYIASAGGLNVYDPYTEFFKYYITDSTPSSIAGNIIYDILVSSDSSVWIATYDGVSHYFPKNQTFKTYPFGEKREHGYPEYTAVSLYEDDNKNIWIGTYGGGLCLFDKKDESFTLFENKLNSDNLYNDNVINQIQPGNENNIILVTEGETFRFNLKNRTYYKAFHKNIIASSVTLDTNKNIWVATRNNGLYVIDQSGIIQHITHISDNNLSLPSNNLNLVYCDNKSNMWVGLINKGVAFININQEHFYNYFKKNNSNSLIGNEVFGLAEDNTGNIWAGTVNGLSIFNPVTNNFKNLSAGQNNSISDNSIWDILYDRDGYMWLGTSKGVDRYSFKTGKFKHFEHNSQDSNSLPSNEIYFQERDSQGNIWIGSYQGLARYSKKNGKWTSYNSTKNRAFANKIIWAIYSDSQNRLWIGTDMGLYKYEPQKDRFSIFGTVNDSNRYLSQAEIGYIIEDSENNLWLSTQMGLVKYNPETNRMKRFTIEDGLPSNVIYGIIEKGNYIWFTSNKGLTKMNKYTYSLANFDSNDGLQSNEFNKATLKLKNGYFMFGGINGITMFNPDEIMDEPVEPDLYFTSLSLNGELVHPNDKRFGLTPLTESVVFANRIDLSYNEKLVVIDFAALEYPLNKKIKYRYRILPNSKNWISLNDKNSVTFTNFPPGKYKLEIQCTTSEQVWLNKTKSLLIVVHPPFYMQKWFYLIEVLIAFLLIFLYVRRRMARIEKTNHRLEQIVRERTEEISAQKEELEIQRDRISEQKTKIEKFAEDLENKVMLRTEELLVAKENAEESDRLKSAFLANMSHEIRTPMNAIIGFSDLLSSPGLSDDEKKAYIDLIRTNSDTLLNLLNDIIDISLIESGKIFISPKEVSVTKLLTKIYDEYKHKKILLDKPRINFTLDISSVVDYAIYIDSFRFRQIVGNLVSNAIKYTSDGKVEISAYNSNNNLLITVKDTGIGIHPEHHDKIFDRFHKIDDSDTNPYRGSGLGLAISKNLVELMGGKIWLESEPFVGSTFYLSFPGIHPHSPK